MKCLCMFHVFIYGAPLLSLKPRGTIENPRVHPLLLLFEMFHVFTEPLPQNFCNPDLLLEIREYPLPPLTRFMFFSHPKR